MGIYFKYNIPIWTHLSMQQIVVDAGWVWQGKGMEREVSGRKSRKRGGKSVQSPQHRTILLMPPYDIGLNYSSLKLLCKTGSPLPMQLSPLFATPFLTMTWWENSPEFTNIPCSWAGNTLCHPRFLPRKFIALWWSAVTSQNSLKLSHCPTK